MVAVRLGSPEDVQVTREKAEMLSCLFAGLADDRYVQATSDHASDVSERHTLVSDPVILGSCRALLKHEPVKMSSSDHGIFRL